MARSGALARAGRGALVLAALLAGAPVAAETRAMARADGVPETAEAAAGRPALTDTVADYLDHDRAEVRIAHAGGAQGSAWAHRVRQWLVAFGVPGEDIRVDPGVTEAGRLALSVEEAGGGW